MTGFGFDTPGETPCPGCFFCPANKLLAFNVIAPRGVNGYVMPGSAPINVTGAQCPHPERGITADTEDTHMELVPFAFSAVLATTYHGFADPWSFGFRSDWESDRQRLIRAIPGIRPDMARNEITNVGFAAGARTPKAVATSKYGPHPFVWVVYGRGMLLEAPETASLGLATIIHNSRRAAGSLPSLEYTFSEWLRFRDTGPDAWAKFQQHMEREYVVSA